MPAQTTILITRIPDIWRYSKMAALLSIALPVAIVQARPGVSSQAATSIDPWPAARRHVQVIDGEAWRFTSRLTRIVELNFTFFFGHQVGKATLSQSLTRIAGAYGFEVNKLASNQDGSIIGIAPDFTLKDLLAGEVLVANNISNFSSPALGLEKQDAIRRAIETEGRGYVGFHGSAEASASGSPGYWSWYEEQLFPLQFDGYYSSRMAFPVYKDPPIARHVVLDGILEEGVMPAQVPVEGDEPLSEKRVDGISTRQVAIEPFRFRRDITRDPAYADRVTVLLKFDARTSNESRYNRPGGNLLSYLYRVGAGMTSYMQLGHDNVELLDPKSGFDGGVGDFDRFLAQLLFFLAGYDKEPCVQAECDGLPLAGPDFQLTGDEYAAPSAILFPSRQIFTKPYEGPYEARVLDVRGRLVLAKSGRGDVERVLDGASLQPGLYFLIAKPALGPVLTRILHHGLRP